MRTTRPAPRGARSPRGARGAATTRSAWVFGSTLAAAAITAALSATPALAASFVLERVDATAAGVASRTHLRFDAQAEPHIAYFKAAGPNGIMYATQSAGAWTIERVSPVGDYCSFDLDTQDAPHVAWGNGAGWDLRWMTKAAGVWTIETADVGTVTGTSIALSSMDEPYIGYAFTGMAGDQLRVARRIAGAWTVEGVDITGTPFEFVSLALTSANEPRVGYKENGPVNDRLLYASRSGGAWTVEEVDPVASEGDWASLALDAGNDPHLSYIAGGNTLRYAYKSGGLWNAETVQMVGACDGTSITVDASGNPHICYQIAGTDLNHAWKEAGLWNIELVDGSANNAGAFCSIAMTPAGMIGASYYDATATDILYAELDPATGVGPADGRTTDGAAPFLAVRPSIVSDAGATVYLRVPPTTSGDVDLSLFDAAGRRVATFDPGRSTGGEHAFSWSGHDAGGRELASGVYFLRLTAGSAAAATERVVLVR